MKKYEAKFCTALGKWWDNVGYKKLEGNFYAIEAKISIGDEPFNYKSGFKPHQLSTLINYNKGNTHWKISDFDQMSTKHFDILFSSASKEIKAAVAIMWIRRGNKTFYLIDPITIQGRIDDGHKSLKELEAEGICFFQDKII